ncbi:hypothetical protein GKG47_11585 [Lactonifactor sp. BIOML-A3]|uniref:hypothetical protein n=1 Tax=unclassified Lactonifactor TaxID=2636670 RepID=UPI0012AF9C84|nr:MULTISPECIES: hypothetical protein [unclassified Lactonifactor]MSA01096.1 hypothetical protein [Lactonifactor sp. BIOML-A5]MSA09895.1 hypothetical protein [Lactonifactor sp. BIOML-A4]MSA13070.1 hypothetical protein [Lactonifactor sp. BIOML-A3]MSA18606.1 hypothetical protein [Lactonifactor sp. BIOML-A2]MSA38309.1 hypothetical protein [Lactonifactor sp. BIOML-A1]
MFKNVIISILAATILMQSGFFQPDNMLQAMIIPVVWYVVFVISLTWIDLRRVTKLARRKDLRERSEKNQTR